MIKTGGTFGYMHEEAIYGPGYKQTGLVLNTTSPMYPSFRIYFSSVSKSLSINQSGFVADAENFLGINLTTYGLTYSLSPGGDMLYVDAHNTTTFADFAKLVDLIRVFYFFISAGSVTDQNASYAAVQTALDSLAVGETLVKQTPFHTYVYDSGVPANSYFKIAWDKLATTTEYPLSTKEAHDAMAKNCVKNTLGIDILTGTYAWLTSELDVTTYSVKAVTGTTLTRINDFNKIYQILKGDLSSNILLAYRVCKDIAEAYVA